MPRMGACEDSCGATQGWAMPDLVRAAIGLCDEAVARHGQPGQPAESAVLARALHLLRDVMGDAVLPSAEAVAALCEEAYRAGRDSAAAEQETQAALARGPRLVHAG